MSTKTLDSGQEDSLKSGNDEDGSEPVAGVRPENFNGKDGQPFICNENAAPLLRCQLTRTAPGP